MEQREKITPKILEHYFSVTAKAIAMVKEKGFDSERENEAKDFLDMAERYFSDGKHFWDNGDLVNAFGAVYYAHAWLDAGARIGLFKVKDSTLFTVDDE
ncbi:DUF357 domain-containing protein [Candidatus Woesearchaeota archaeon]|jgi:uncharacterized protein|nr:DUF357 domain-containing protein [Candidatus Woesearchaeota archaeon]MBT6518917.1 DUF357 domain-containing protein [Candidatus Woesearchaeota archaeon]MBT7367585.1 DUF357 domain-containing protein [Candidatus Woesearchaeota archaeon]